MYKQDFVKLMEKCQISWRAISDLEQLLSTDLSRCRITAFMEDADVIAMNLLNIPNVNDTFFEMFWTLINGDTAIPVFTNELYGKPIKDFNDFYDFWNNRKEEDFPMTYIYKSEP